MTARPTDQGVGSSASAPAGPPELEGEVLRFKWRDGWTALALDGKLYTWTGPLFAGRWCNSYTTDQAFEARRRLAAALATSQRELEAAQGLLRDAAEIMGPNAGWVEGRYITAQRLRDFGAAHPAVAKGEGGARG